MKSSAGESLPKALDFFQYAEGGQGKRKTSSHKDESRHAKRSKVTKDEGIESEEDTENSDEENEEMGAEEPGPPTQKHRITMKGLNPPKEAATFEEIKERYSLPQQLYANLAKNDYRYPTGIQSSGVPVLLEVRACHFGNMVRRLI